MKFFTAALAALAAGSAIAAPVLDTRVTDVVTDVVDQAGVEVPKVDAPVPAAVNDAAAPVTNNVAVIIVVKKVTTTVASVEDTVKHDLEVITGLLAGTVDAQALLKAISTLKSDLLALLDAVPLLHGLLLNADNLLDDELETVADLVARIEALLAEVEKVLKPVGALKADILAIVGPEVRDVLVLVLKVADPVVTFVLTAVAPLHLDGTLAGLLAKVNTSLVHILGLTAGVSELLGAVVTLLHL